MKSKSNIWLFKYLWVIAILPKEIQLIILFIAALFLLWKKEGKTAFDVFSLLIIGYASIHVISIFYNLIQEKYESTRIIAAFNTAFIWYIAIVFYLYYKNSNSNINEISRCCFINNTILIFLSLTARCLSRQLSGWYLPILGNALYRYENPYSRFLGFMEYPTLVVAFVLLMLPGAIYFIICNTGSKFLIPAISGYYALSCIPVYFCYSRSGYILLLAGFIGLIYLYWKTHLQNQKRMLLMLLIIVTTVIGLISLHGYIAFIIQKLLSMRDGSNSTRQQIYMESINAFQKSPLVGCGIKKIGKAGYPLGSHSSYLGFLYKTGIIGFFLAISAFLVQAITLCKRCLKIEIWHKSIWIFFMLLIYGYCIFEDIDGVDWLICIWFAMLGLLQERYTIYDYRRNSLAGKLLW